MKNKTLILSAMVVALAFPAWSSAYDLREGRISGLGAITEKGNYNFRVSLKNQKVLCEGGIVNWAFVNESEVGYKSIVEVLTLAKMQNSVVQVASEPVDTPYGIFCHIIAVYSPPL